MDYTSGPYIATFPVGTTIVTFYVSITDDTILEGNEDFMLTTDPSLPYGVTLGTPTATVTIVDNDSKLKLMQKYFWYKQVDILISKKQSLQILYHVASYNHHL